MRASTLLGVLATLLLLTGEARATEINFSSTRTDAQGCPAKWHTFTDQLAIFVSADLGDSVTITSGSTFGTFTSSIEILGTFVGIGGPITTPLLKIGGSAVAQGGTLLFGNNTYTGAITVSQSGVPTSSILVVLRLGAATTVGGTPAYPDQCYTVSGTLILPEGFVPPSIPEPATLSLVSLGVFGLLAGARSTGDTR